MKRIDFKCTLLTDIVMSAQTATEGGHQSLNFIPGSNFLGILASSVYKKDAAISYTLFHSGKVRFGDAHIVSGGIRSFQIPFSWYFPKGGRLTEGNNYMLNFMSRKNFDEIINRGILLKQARDGYFTEKGDYVSFVKIFSQKTACDSVKRRSAENEMFGYEALQKGSEWQFCIDVDDDTPNHDEIVEELKMLTGKKRLGRSKTAEFGSIEIELMHNGNENIQPGNITSREITLENRSIRDGVILYENNSAQLVFLYAESRLSFRDKETGQPTFTPTAGQLGLPENTVILWDRSQIRTGIYAPWNYKRGCRDEDRVFIEKGSVFVVDVSNVKTSFTDERINNGVGLYRTDGFGKLLINPGFLNFDPETGKPVLQLNIPDKLSENEDTEILLPQDSDLIKWIKQQNDFGEVLRQVDAFMNSPYNLKLFTKVTRSQWGNLRSYALSADDKPDLLTKLFKAPEEGFTGGFLTHGVALKQWKDGKLKNTIERADERTCLLFVEKLAARMQKKEVQNEIQ